ncbi:MAG: outer membrane beta-barrel protein [Gemmataceae bacterium]
MTRMSRLGGGLAAFLAGAVAQAQPPLAAPPAAAPPVPVQEVVTTPISPGTTAPASRPLGLEAESLPREIAEDIRRDAVPPATPAWGPTPVDEVGILRRSLQVDRFLGDSGIRTFGWVEGGYTGSSTGSGPMSVQPRQNRYGNEFLLNQIGLVVQKPLRQDQFDWGFNVRYFAGADAALGQPKGGIDDPPGNPRFGQDFRDLNLTAHLPILTEGGVNLKVGRMNTIIGWNGFLSPYRPMYSSDYQFFYSQDGAFTGALAQVVISDQLDVWSGITAGANTFFEKRSSDSVCYIGQVNYWLTPEKRTRLTASVYTGPNAIFAAPGLAGDHNTTVELRVQHNWSERFTQVVQNNMGWDTNTPVGTGSWYGLYTVGIYHLTREWDVIGRAEWFRDVRGTRTGVDANFSEVTFGLNWHPTPYFELRPEIRGDFADRPAFGTNGAHTDRSQLTGAISFLTKF